MATHVPSHHGNSDEKSTGKSTSREKAANPKVATVRPELVTVQKDHMNLLLAKCRNMETQLQAMKNLQLVIQDAFEQVRQEKVKSEKYQTALISAESRLSEMIRVQLENTALQHQLPFLSDVQSPRPVGRATCIPSSSDENESQHMKKSLQKSYTLPGITNDLETDGGDCDSGFQTHSPSWQSNVSNQGLLSLKSNPQSVKYKEPLNHPQVPADKAHTSSSAVLLVKLKLIFLPIWHHAPFYALC